MTVEDDTFFIKRQTSNTRPCRKLLLLLVLPFILNAAPASARSITDFVTCASAKMEAPHDWHIPKAVFQTTDEQFFAWVELTDVSGVHPVEMQVFRPDGTYYGKEVQVINETNGPADWWRMSAWWKIKNYDPAKTPGHWRLDLLIDGARQRSIYFEIKGEIAKADAADPEVPAPHPIMCVTEISSDLIHWTPIQTNPLPMNLLPDATGKRGVRLKLGEGNVRKCVVEISPDLTNWTAVQTNDFSLSSSLKASNAALGTIRYYRAVLLR